MRPSSINAQRALTKRGTAPFGNPEIGTPRLAAGSLNIDARRKTRISGLYAVTPDEHDTDVLIDKVNQALAGGARAVQYRNKSADTPLRYAQALGLLQLCRPRRVPLIINDHLDIALAIDADGVHLGAEDGDLAAARAALGPDRILGASCYNRYELAVAARTAGVNSRG